MSNETLGEAKKLIDEFKENKLLSIVFIIVLIGILGIAGYYFYDNYRINKEIESNEGYYRELYLIDDTSTNLDEQIENLKAYAEEYDGYKGGSVTNYIIGTNFMKSKEWELAIESLEKVNLDDENIGPIAKGCIGDCYMEMAVEENSNDLFSKAYNAYMNAAKKASNQFVSPRYLMKAAVAAEKLNDYQSSLENYTKIKKDYPKSNEAKTIDKYIARAENM